MVDDGAGAMKSFRNTAWIILALFLLAACDQGPTAKSVSISRPAEAPDVASKDFGAYILHFNALSTDQLTAEVARAYGITRSSNRALLTVSIIKKAEGTIGTPVAGKVVVRAANLTGQAKELTLKEIDESSAIYYVGDLAVVNRETLIFELDVTPENETKTLEVKFSRQFYSN